MISKYSLFTVGLVCLLVGACVRPTKPLTDIWVAPDVSDIPIQSDTSEEVTPTPAIIIRHPGDAIETPTPDPVHVLPTPRTETVEYIVKYGESLGRIAQRYGVPLRILVETNNIVNPDLVEVGQVLIIPPPPPGIPGSGYKIIPDSELVNGPLSASFDIFQTVKNSQGYLASYREEINGERMGGAGIVQRVSQEFSVNPRLLLAILEYHSGWLTQSSPREETLEYPMGLHEVSRKGLYAQLAWAANNLNRGYYLWRVNGLGTWVLADGSVVSIDPTINAGTAAVQCLFASLYDRQRWDESVSEDGLFKVYFEWFGYPFDYAYEPVVPEALVQPVMQFPFEAGGLWAYTGGPHGGWGSGSAWAAIDFAPPGEGKGCVQSEAWVVAVADGFIVRSDRGAVVQDLGGDGFEETGWSVLYMHIEARDRVEQGTFLRAGDRLGHPSCEGGISSGTHVHLARRYNGEWIPADQQIPFVLDGWITQGSGIEYDGFLVRGDEKVEAWEGYFPANQIQR